MTNREEAIKNFKALDDISHVLTVPSRYIGSTNYVEQNMYIFENDKFVFKSVSYIPGLLKIIEEILDNSVDAWLNSMAKTPITIKVDINDHSCRITDDGPGIPISKYNDMTGKLPELNGKYIPELAWAKLKAGGSFKEQRVGAGIHGEGSKLTNIFSNVFIGKTCNGKKTCIVSCKDNMHIVNTKIKNTDTKAGTEVYFEPDLKRFNITEIGQIHIDLIYQRLLNLCVAFPTIKFYFNGKKIVMQPKNFINYFSPEGISIHSNNALIGIFPNDTDDFQHYSYVNGLRTSKGGSHIDYIINQITAPICDKLKKKFKSIKPGDIKNKFGLVVFLQDFSNPRFDSQTKECLSNSAKDISSHLNNAFDFDDFAKKIMKSDALMFPIVETFKLKEEMKHRQEMKRSKKERISSDKYMSSIGDKKYLLLVEGLSARAGLSGALGRNGYGFYAGRGVPLNVYDAKNQKIAANDEFKDIMNILGIDPFDKADKKICFDKIVIATDADLDGIFITSQYLGWFMRFAPNLFNEGRIAKLITPLVILKNNKDKPIKYFYSLKEFKAYEENNDISKYNIEYLKGLGSYDKDAFIQLFEEKGFDYYLQEYRVDDNGKAYINDWLSGKEAEKRKAYLRNYTLNTEMM